MSDGSTDITDDVIMDFKIIKYIYYVFANSTVKEKKTNNNCLFQNIFKYV